MNKLKMDLKYREGITLISLVVTIVVLIILASVSLNILLGNNGLLNKAQTASDETKKSQATETMNLKITNIQISSYAETQQLPNLQYLADKLCEDNDMEYVLTASKEHASLDKIDVTNISSIFTKLKEYPYEFEINSSLQLASIDGISVATSTDDQSTSNSNIYDEWTTWLSLAGISNPEQYNDTNVVENETLMNKLLNNDNAVAYMLKSKYFIMPAICSSETALNYILNNTSVRNKVILNNEWLNKIIQSGNISKFDSVATTVPTMTSYTSPSGNVIYSGSIYSSRYAWNAFRPSELMELTGLSTTDEMYVGYVFPQVNHLYKVTLTNRNDDYVASTQYYQFKVQGSNDGLIWTDLSDTLTNGQVAGGTSAYYLFYNGHYQQYRLINVNSRVYNGVPRIGAAQIQFYCVDAVE